MSINVGSGADRHKIEDNYHRIKEVMIQIRTELKLGLWKNGAFVGLHAYKVMGIWKKIPKRISVSKMEGLTRV
jgi:hypothetical protein